jgi:hypothetical protein
MSLGSIDASKFAPTAPALPGAIATKAAAANPLIAQSTHSTAASLAGQIRATRVQLNDWVTCVSATTPKGRAEILSLSAQISAAQEHINRLAPAASGGGKASGAGSPGAHLDVWA